ncbi:hypothetical protein CFBP6762_02620 [Xanthomonas arboricola pv. fragariae]|nr:hypothetical protein CFBP6762_02620 [Xanthomonas arboricola pv. fragariae]
MGFATAWLFSSRTSTTSGIPDACARVSGRPSTTLSAVLTARGKCFLMSSHNSAMSLRSRQPPPRNEVCLSQSSPPKRARAGPCSVMPHRTFAIGAPSCRSVTLVTIRAACSDESGISPTTSKPHSKSSILKETDWNEFSLSARLISSASGRKYSRSLSPTSLVAAVARPSRSRFAFASIRRRSSSTAKALVSKVIPVEVGMIGSSQVDNSEAKSAIGGRAAGSIAVPLAMSRSSGAVRSSAM